MRIAFFDAKSYDIESFNEVNKDYNFDIRYYQERLSISTVPLAKGADVVCIFVNAECDAQVIDEFSEQLESNLLLFAVLVLISRTSHNPEFVYLINPLILPLR